MAFVRDLEGFEVADVLCNGKSPELNKGLTYQLSTTWHQLSLSGDDFVVLAQGPLASVFTVDQPRFTCWGQCKLPVRLGRVDPRPK